MSARPGSFGRTAPAAVLIAATVGLGAVGPARGVGLDGPQSADRRVSIAVGGGVDRVAGYGHATYPFVEAAISAEAIVWRRWVLGGELSARQDLDEYDDALQRWRGRRSPAVVAQLFAGYDGERFHVSLGPWLYGARRDRRDFRAAVLPYGVLRLRFGGQDRWHFNFRIADGAPFTAEGGALAVRAMLGAPPRGRHRASGGIYASLGENTLGLTLTDEIAGAGPGGTTVRAGGLLATDLERASSRGEATAFIGLVW